MPKFYNPVFVAFRVGLPFSDPALEWICSGLKLCDLAQILTSLYLDDFFLFFFFFYNDQISLQIVGTQILPIISIIIFTSKSNLLQYN